MIQDRQTNGNEQSTQTRRQHASRINLENNTQIDKSNPIKTKKIVVPKFKEDKESYLKLIDYKKKAMDKLMKEHLSFVRNKVIEEKDIAMYEICDDDMEFLKDLFPTELELLTTPKEMIDSTVVRKMEAVISFLEKSNDLTELYKKYIDTTFTKEVLDKVIEYWKKKCRIVKRPLLRKNWKIINTNQLYGEVDVNKLAFKNREKKKRPQRNANKVSDEENLNFLQKLKKEKEIALYVCSLILHREKLKLDNLTLLPIGQSESEKSTKMSARIDKHLRSSKRLVIEVDNLINEYNPPVISEPEPAPVIQPVKPQIINNDYSYFTASLIADMHQQNFKFDDFRSDNIQTILNEKIRKINKKQNQVSSNSKEKKIDLTKKINLSESFDYKKQRIIKRPSITNPTSFFIDKVKSDKNNDEDSFYLPNNFTFEPLVKRDYLAFQSEFSHCNLLSDYASNPYVYCGKSNFNNTSKILEKIKLARYNQLIKPLSSFQEETVYNFKDLNHDVEMLANAYLDKIKIGENFKNFMRSAKK